MAFAAKGPNPKHFLFSKRIQYILFPLLFGGIVIVATLVIFSGLKLKAIDDYKKSSRLELGKHVELISSELTNTLHAIEGMADRWNIRGGTPKNEWEKDASAQIDIFTGLEAMFWVDANINLRWLVTSESVLESDEDFKKFIQYRKSFFEATSLEEQKTKVESFSIDSVQVFWAISPIYVNKKFEGFLVGYSRANSYLDFILLEGFNDDFSISILENKKVIYGSSNDDISFLKNWSFFENIELLGLEWVLRLVPKANFFEKDNSHLPQIILIAGILTGVLVFTAVFFGMKARASAKEIQVTNVHLKEEVGERQKAERELSKVNEELEERVEIRTVDLMIAKEEAEKSSRAKSEFLSRMSHELRTPMNAILGFGQLLEFDAVSPLSDLQSKNVKEILKAGNHLLDLINEVLDLASVESGKIGLSMEEVDILEVLTDTLPLVIPLAESFKVKIQNNIPENWVIYVDRTRLKQILLNLISNAIKYNKSNGECLLSVGKATNDRVFIKVEDTGVGIHVQS